MQALTSEQIRAVIARGKLRDTIFKALGIFCLALALLVIVALIADMAIKGSERFTLDFFLNFASRRATQAGKPFKLIMIACMRKLITIINAIINTNQPWRNNSPITTP